MGASASAPPPESKLNRAAVVEALNCDEDFFKKVFGDVDRVDLGLACAALGVPTPAPRPATAEGPFLRIVTVNDSYALSNYARVATAIRAARASAETLGCVVKTFMNGDFLSPCVVTSLDGGRAMIDGLNSTGFDYACIGNHEFDLGIKDLAEKLRAVKPTIVNSNVLNEEFSYMPKFSMFKVGERDVAVGGFLTGDPSIYSPTSCPKCTPVNEAILNTWREAKASLGRTPDLFLPMTHQLTSEDRATGKIIGNHSDLKIRTPLLLAGHDHEVFIEEAGPSMIVKVGMDCENIGLCDVWWTADGTVCRRVELVPASAYPPEPGVEALRKKTDEFVEGMMSSPIAQLERPMSSKKVRFESSSMASFLLTLIKKGLRSEGVELVLIVGGAVRAGKDYEAGDFLMRDLFSELAFDCHQAIVKVPGQIIAESIKLTRSAPKPAPSFLHCDEDAVVTEDHVLTVVDGKPFDEDKLYTISIYQNVLKGLNNIQPIYSYAQSCIQVPEVEACQPAKNIVVKHCMKEAWRSVLHVEDWDKNHDGVLSPEELNTGVKKAFAELDENGDGFIDKAELRNFLEKEKGGKKTMRRLSQMMDALDVNKDGKIDAEELKALAF